jgi:hypothetical protein
VKTQRDSIHEAIVTAGRPLHESEIVAALDMGPHRGQDTPENTVRRDLNEGHMERGTDQRWAPPEWRKPLEVELEALSGDTLGVSALVVHHEDMASYVAHQTIRNIILSYQAATDPIAEAVQNALDVLGEGGTTKVSYDPASGVLTVADDGPGLSREQFATYVRPNVSTKGDRTQVGRKGVGLTFLCFCADHVVVESGDWAAVIEHGRQWADDPFGWRWPTQPSITFERREPRTGVRYQAALPRAAHAALGVLSNAEQLGAIIRTQTPVGSGLRQDVTVKAQLRSSDWLPVPVAPLLPTDLVDPSELLDLATAEGSPRPEYEGAYRRWTTDELRELIEREYRRRQGDRASHLKAVASTTSMKAYGYFAKSRDALASLGDHENSIPTLGEHGLRVVASGQPLSRPAQPVRLRSATGYHNRLWIRLDLDAEPDIGRKSVPALEVELQEITSAIGAALVREGAPWVEADDPGVRGRQDEDRRRTRSHRWSLNGHEMNYWDVVDEQDVVALYNRLVGAGLLAHLPVVASWGSTGVYDARARHIPALTPECFADQPGKAGDDVDICVEFKLKAAQILPDIARRKKSFENIDLLVAWELGRWRDDGPWLAEPAKGATRVRRRFAGATHIIKDTSGEPVVRLMCLRDLLTPFAVTVT